MTTLLALEKQFLHAIDISITITILCSLL